MEIKTRKDSYDEYTPVDKKLGDLLMRGWVMLAESCPVETCHCPLMESKEKQKYCVGCEMWHFDNERPKKQRFGELVSLQGKQNVKLKENPNASTEVQKIPKPIDIKFDFSGNVINILQMKLVHLSNQLSVTTDLSQTEKLLNCINVCIGNISAAQAIYKN